MLLCMEQIDFLRQNLIRLFEAGSNLVGVHALRLLNTAPVLYNAGNSVALVQATCLHHAQRCMKARVGVLIGGAGCRTQYGWVMIREPRGTSIQKPETTVVRNSLP